MKVLFPHIYLNRITDITVDSLIKHNIKLLIIDVDNTLSTHGGQKPVEGLKTWIKEMESANIKLIILSNAKEKRVKPFATLIGLKFISLGLKPLPFGYLKCLRRFNVKARNAAIVGDQLFTDIIGGKLIGIKTIMVKPILLENTKSFVFRRKLESKILKNYFNIK